MFKLIIMCLKSRSNKSGVRCYQSEYLPWQDPFPPPDRGKCEPESLEKVVDTWFIMWDC